MAVTKRADLEYAIKSGDIEACKLKMGVIDDYFVRRSIQYGHLHILKWIQCNGYSMTSKIHRFALEVGNMSILIWLWDYRKEFKSEHEWTKSMYAITAEYGHLDVVKWLQTLNLPNDPDSHPKSYPWYIEACKRAVNGGHLSVVEWIFDNYCGWYPSFGVSAAEHGHVRILQWARANGLEFAASLCSPAALRNGHLHVLQWLYDNQLVSTNQTLIYDLLYSTTCNWLNILRWLKRNGYPFRPDYYFLIMQKFQKYYWVRQSYPETPPSNGFFVAFAFWTKQSVTLEYFLACKWIQEHDQVGRGTSNVIPISWSNSKTKWIQTVDCQVDKLEIPSCLSYLIKCYI